MRMNNIKVLSIFSLIIFFSTSSIAETSSFCSDPLKKICRDTYFQRNLNYIYINNLKEEIRIGAKARSDIRIAEMKKKIPSIRFFKRWKEEFKITNQEIMREAKSKIIDLESVITDEDNVKVLKNYMKQAIDESNFNPTAKNNFKAVVDSIIIGNFSDYIERTGLEDSVLMQLLGNACGSDGLIDNAFATTFNKERYVLVCPGYLVTMTQTPDLKERFNTILQAITHEMGHHIDNSIVGEKMYEPYLSCLTKNYSDSFNSTKEDKAFCKRNEKNPELCKAKVIGSHAGELIADAWGMKVLSIHAKAQNYNFGEVDEMLTSTWTKLCESKDEGIHPSGDFRIGTLLRSTPEISSVLACDNSILSRPSCTFEGEVSLVEAIVNSPLDLSADSNK